jgi:hypothetical protein
LRGWEDRQRLRGDGVREAKILGEKARGEGGGEERSKRAVNRMAWEIWS